MKINTILSIFAPKDIQFYTLLNEIADIAENSAVLLQELFESADSERINELCQLIKTEESNGDKVTRKIFKALNETFITPFDREDISSLTDTMDDVIDIIKKKKKKVMLFSPETLMPATLEMAVVIKNEVSAMKTAVYELSKLKKTDKQIREYIREIKHFEEEADRIYEKGASGLFRSDMRTIEIIKLKEIIQEMEKAANRINSVGKILKTIVVKYA
jgi:predicted phosphate transport protein (TIGR00153 family)